MTHKISILLAGIGGAVVMAASLVALALASRWLTGRARTLKAWTIQSMSASRCVETAAGTPSYYMDTIDWRFPS
jgi:hypothetical protein